MRSDSQALHTLTFPYGESGAASRLLTTERSMQNCAHEIAQLKIFICREPAAKGPTGTKQESAPAAKNASVPLPAVPMQAVQDPNETLDHLRAPSESGSDFPEREFPEREPPNSQVPGKPKYLLL